MFCLNAAYKDATKPLGVVPLGLLLLNSLHTAETCELLRLAALRQTAVHNCSPSGKNDRASAKTKAYKGYGIYRYIHLIFRDCLPSFCMDSFFFSFFLQHNVETC